MKIKVTLIVAAVTSLFLNGCVTQNRPPVVNPPQINGVISANSQNNNLSCHTLPVNGSFDQIALYGDIVVTINGHQPQTQLRVYGLPSASRSLNVYVRNGVLNVQNGNHFISPVSVELDITDNIHNVTVFGDAKVTLKNVGDNNLSLAVGGQSNTTLTGNLVIQKITATDNAVLHAYWLNTTNLQLITNNNANVFLGGIVTNLDLIASDDSNIDAKYLRVDNAFIRTMDSADVGVNTKRVMSAWSSDQSSIYYFRDPGFSAYYLDGSGSTLRMAGIPDR
jgi:hypothetical protein